MNLMWLYASGLTFICAISIGSSLECYTCQTIEGFTKGNPCLKPIQCGSSSLCLSATFSLKQNFDNRKVYSTLKMCMPKTDGKECDLFNDFGSMINAPGFTFDFAEKCYTCDKDGCNGSSGPSKASLTLFLGFSLVSLLWCFASRS